MHLWLPMLLASVLAGAGTYGVLARRNAGLPDAGLRNDDDTRRLVAGYVRAFRPRVVILPYLTGRHPDHRIASQLAYDACFLAGLKKLDEYTEPHRPHKVIYTSLYANVTPSFVVDISAQFERRMDALLAGGGYADEVAHLYAGMDLARDY